MSPLATRGYDFRQLRMVARLADTVTIRLLLAHASLLYVILLLFPSFFTWVMSAVRFVLFMPAMPPVDVIPVFDRPAYAVMALIPGAEWTWSAAFFLHFVGVHWRIVEVRERKRWALAINMLGFVTWTYSTLATNLALGTIGPQTALEWVIVGYSGWMLYRTGMQKELVSH